MTADIWTDLLAAATRDQDPVPKKHLVICGERAHGKKTVLAGLINKSSAESSLDVFPYKGSSGFLARNHAAFVACGGVVEEKEAGPLRLDVLDDTRLKGTEGLIVGYEWIDISQPGEADRVPPLSVYTTPSSEPLMLQTLSNAIPKAPGDTGVIIVLDWSKPQTMLEELLRWLTWVESWTTEMTTPEERIAGRERLKSIIQHYGDPKIDTTMPDVVLPLDPETLIHNQCGIPITIVITRSDTIQSTGDKLIARGLITSKGYSGRSGEETEEYLAGMSWEERVEWMMQVVRTIALRYGASVIHTTTADPGTFKIFRAHTLNALYKIPDSSRLAPKLAHRFPFPYPPNALDRDRLVVPVGWDSPTRIKVLREGFDVRRIGAMWDDELRRKRALRDLWRIVVPDSREETRESRPLVTCEPEQVFLSRQLEFLLRDPRDRKTFRPPSTPRTTTRSALEDGTMPVKPVGVVGPVASGGLAMPSVELAVARMEGDEPEPTPAVPATSNELLNNFFQGLIAGRRTPGSTPVKE